MMPVGCQQVQLLYGGKIARLILHKTGQITARHTADLNPAEFCLAFLRRAASFEGQSLDHFVSSDSSPDSKLSQAIVEHY